MNSSYKNLWSELREIICVLQGNRKLVVEGDFTDEVLEEVAQHTLKRVLQIMKDLESM